MVIGHAPVDQSDLGGRPSVDPSRREHQLLRRRPTDALGEPDRHAPDGHQAPLAVRVAQAGRLVGDQQIAGEGEFEPTGVAVAVDPSDRGHREPLERIDRLGLEVRRRRLLLGRDRIEVVTRAERAARPGQHDAAHRRVAADCVEVVAERHERGGVQCVQLVRAVQREGRQPVVAVVTDHQVVAHSRERMV